MVQPKNKNIMKRVIVILLGLLFISFEYRGTPQNISVSSEDEKTIHNDIIAKNITYNVNFKQKHPYAKFCEEYGGVAIQHHLDCGVPASIQLAQAIAESGGGISDIAKLSNNLFGMKEAKQRRTTAIGTKNNHAYYKHWHDSVIDYLLYQRAYYNGVEDYYSFLSRMGYAANKKYIDTVKMVLWKWSSC